MWVEGEQCLGLIIAASDAGLEGVPDAGGRGGACNSPARPL